MHHGIARADMGEEERSDGGHAAVERRSRLSAVQRRKPRLHHGEIGMTEAAIDIGLGFPRQTFGAFRLRAVEEGLVDILGLPGRAIDEGGGGVDRRFGRPMPCGRIIAVGDGEGFQMQAGLVAHA